MTRTSTFFSSTFVSTLAALIVACGGGGGDTYAADETDAALFCAKQGLEFPRSCDSGQTMLCVAAGHTCQVQAEQVAP